jgi:hypothetical protein
VPPSKGQSSTTLGGRSLSTSKLDSAATERTSQAPD